MTSENSADVDEHVDKTTRPNISGTTGEKCGRRLLMKPQHLTVNRSVFTLPPDSKVN
jgi:hypothetical protein